MQTVKWAVAKLQGDKTASFCKNMSGREVTGPQMSIPVFDGTLLPMDLWTPSAFPDLFSFWGPQNKVPENRVYETSLPRLDNVKLPCQLYPAESAARIVLVFLSCLMREVPARWGDLARGIPTLLDPV